MGFMLSRTFQMLRPTLPASRSQVRWPAEKHREVAQATEATTRAGLQQKLQTQLHERKHSK